MGVGHREVPHTLHVSEQPFLALCTENWNGNTGNTEVDVLKTGCMWSLSLVLADK